MGAHPSARNLFVWPFGAGDRILKSSTPLTPSAAPCQSYLPVTPTKMEIREERSSSMFMRVRGIRLKREIRRTARSPKVLEPTSSKTWSILWSHCSKNGGYMWMHLSRNAKKSRT